MSANSIVENEGSKNNYCIHTVNMDSPALPEDVRKPQCWLTLLGHSLSFPAPVATIVGGNVPWVFFPFFALLSRLGARGTTTLLL
ncbi:hypothetical protein DEU56DRAFT_979352 [Suillus clintonianus]|uniref:uncharacterized protein n=1 Tax=Suillus clintonianus TaxID=1904413 RepID=UPI001B85E459|nr:uncharacterized protein DEU56DRAFT_979352 [Suillus clintonianus]KAG2143694.1 hypothetical protein DEU56DRAFT_979352 [Suillus clintonianus]